jgi:glycosyltransferase involved in cell wall biosynthesis
MPDSAWLTAPSAIAGPSSFRPGGARRVAVVHEWLASYAGSERVVREILAIYPEADLFGVVDFLSDADRARLFGKTAKTTFIQRLPFARKKFRGYLPLMPLAVEQLDLSGYDLVISSNHAVAKGVLTGPDQVHICYCHTPIRYAWDLQHQYLREAGLTKGIKGALVRAMLHYMRLWDYRTAAGVDHFVANSHYIARRIKKIYGRPAAVIPPPVDIEAFPMVAVKEDFYVTASRMVPYKRMDLVVAAFALLPERRLIVLGDGPELEKIKALAGPNVTMLGYQGDDVLRDHLQRARAFVFAAEEDFGILPVEAQACGTPVIAYGRGGALDSICGIGDAAGAKPTGVFFQEQSAEAIAQAVRDFEGVAIDPHDCRRQAERFAAARFRAAFSAFIDAAMAGEDAVAG